MIRPVACPMFALLLMSAAAAAQDRIRSPDYTGEDAIEACYDWETGFDFLRCERLPIPGQTGMMGQTYTLADGSRRTLTEDPRIAAEKADPVEMAAELGPVAPDDPGVGGMQRADRTGEGRGPDAEDPALPGTDGSDAGANEPPTSKIVEEDFELPPVVPVLPGRAEILPMATGHLNRIETPFGDPMVRTSAQADALNVEFDQNYIYVSVTQPVTLFIHQRGYPDPAVVVSLVPQRIAPRQVRLSIPPPMTAQVKKNEAAATGKAAGTTAAAGPQPNSKGIRRSTPAGRTTSSLAHLIQTFARGRVPKGFQHVSLAGYSAQSFCRATGGARFSFQQGSAVASSEYIILRGMVMSSRAFDLDERACAINPETLAVAFSPRTLVGPDHPTDFFVLIRRPDAAIRSARGE